MPAAPASAAAPATETCPLCGTGFDAAGQGCRPSCPMSRGCRVVCCPSCGYSFPQENAGLAGRLKQFFQRRHDGGRIP
ncbi:MAG: hypothetical protein NDI82_09785 [Anaeromyxobacteraceae bacterium]|nr:hypothetical protein [Anaeromyxobacteraceae bacterium]